ncbi:hypothetical protein KFU94_31030 [Chloroflexi bacterium TSY]|nr:hypothetical protein [Chloroflexi bacterium TSY]
MPRRGWINENPLAWEIGWWLWMLVVVGWMLFLVTLIWRYSPAHRVPTMLQSGLIIIASVLVVIGILVWMAVLPVAVDLENAVNIVPLIDAFALGAIGAGCLMGGIVTSWICIDLLRLRKLTWSWVVPGLIAGLCMIPSPFLLPQPYLLAVSAFFQ